MTTLTNTVADTTVETVAETTKAATSKAMAKFDGLNEANKEIVLAIVEDVKGKIGGEKIDLDLLLGLLDQLNGMKKAAKEVKLAQDKEAKESRKLELEAQGEALKAKLHVGDKIDFIAKTAGLTFHDVKIEKITEKRIRLEITADSSCTTKEKKTTVAGDVTNYKIGMKSVKFEDVVLVNGKTVAEILK